jgi:hypothetical protein
MFTTRSVTRCYNQEGFQSSSEVEARSNTSTVALRVVRGDEKGSLESETVKYGRDTDPRMTALARASSNCKRQTHPLVSESAHVNKSATV